MSISFTKYMNNRGMQYVCTERTVKVIQTNQYNAGSCGSGSGVDSSYYSANQQYKPVNCGGLINTIGQLPRFMRIDVNQ